MLSIDSNITDDNQAFDEKFMERIVKINNYYHNPEPTLNSEVIQFLFYLVVKISK